MNVHAFDVFRGNFIHVFPVVLAEQYLIDARSLGGQYFLTQTSDWQDITAQSDLATHGQFCLDLALSEQGSQCCQQSDPCGWAVFWNGPFWHMDMDVIAGE